MKKTNTTKKPAPVAVANSEGMHQLGKKAAGRELDGRTHDEFPVGSGYEPPPVLSKGEKTKLGKLVKIVREGMKASLAACTALHEIKTYENGKLWRATHRYWQDYCRDQWDYKRSYAFELVERGGIIIEIEAATHGKTSAKKDILPTNASHLGPLKALPEGERGKYWMSLMGDNKPEDLTAKKVKAGVVPYAKVHKLELNQPVKTVKNVTPRKNQKEKAAAIVVELRDATLNMAETDDIEALLVKIEALLK